MKINSHRMSKLLIVITLMAFLAGCGGSGDKADEPATATQEKLSFSKWEPGTLEAEIEIVLNETVDRMRYGDKSGLYDMEFDYLRDAETFDDYLKRGEVRWANADSMDYIEVLRVTPFGDDSVSTDVLIHMTKSNGTKLAFDEHFLLYHIYDYWNKPFVSRIEDEIKYQNLIRDAEQAAREEADLE